MQPKCLLLHCVRTVRLADDDDGLFPEFPDLSHTLESSGPGSPTKTSDSDGIGGAKRTGAQGRKRRNTLKLAIPGQTAGQSGVDSGARPPVVKSDGRVSPGEAAISRVSSVQPSVPTTMSSKPPKPVSIPVAC